MTDGLMDRRSLLCGAGALAAGWAMPALAADFASRRIMVTVRGSGRDVLLIPGLASGPGIWNGVTGQMPGYRWHLVHVRGFSGLAADANGSGPVVQPVADEIARYIAAAGLRRPAVVGHSMGGTLAMMQGLKGLASRVMVVDMLPAGAAMVGGTANGMGYLADQLSQYFTGTAAGRRYLAQIVAQAPGAEGSNPEVIATALRDLANTDLGPQLGRIGVPMSVVYAVGADQAQSVEITRRFRAAYAAKKDAKLLPIGPSGHVVMADQPTRFNAALGNFLKGV
ncbi:alpha/beta fold hydrolase [Sphingobium yanoikuyae]|jgi:pimeloyl-ACP methyl ester carboxylesterase|uniref:Alpha/beta hydrolase n=1 Tax=Sphingobium yanoikuyae TaxID=13690 RepID=A0A085K7H0_SPHYA|nr:alpha/beta hydrolase [Sphingobium yanoikuyae]AYO78178.1 alpha/beta hydrolase [Sphingobium yanoikuyae]KFD28666.1 alpha/beta hydrolase [Sphingobium yanoikuyae]KZC82744.1 alpha/beta hydrolase [Sphingobium yanoikuyae]MDV3480281.1 alpha/beta hydrolase [Sphingobium yanoikuyae]